jgi:N-acetylneuraminic acid mutarotase
MEPEPSAGGPEPRTDTPNVVAMASGIGYSMDPADPLSLLSVSQLRAILAYRGLDTNGRRSSLITRARQAGVLGRGDSRTSHDSARDSTLGPEHHLAAASLQLMHHTGPEIRRYRRSRRYGTGSFGVPRILSSEIMRGRQGARASLRNIGFVDNARALYAGRSNMDDENEEEDENDDDIDEDNAGAAEDVANGTPGPVEGSEEDDDVDLQEEDSCDDGCETTQRHAPRPIWISHPPDPHDRSLSPKPCAGHAIAAHSGSFFIFGGFSDFMSSAQSRYPGYSHEQRHLDRFGMNGMDVSATDNAQGHGQQLHSNAVHEYNVDSREWLCLSPCIDDDSRVPKPRRHASLVVHGGSLFVYGGFDKTDAVLGDLWEFKIERRKWARIVYAARTRLVSHDGVADLTEAVGLHGLNEANIHSINTQQHHAFMTPATLALANSSGGALKTQVPGPRAEHTAIVHANRMVVFGGYDGKKKLNDTYVFDFVTSEWFRPACTEHNAPSRRCKHSAVLYQSRMFVLGGFQYNDGENYALTDIHALDMQTFTWTPLLMSVRCPDALQGHKAVVCGNSMYVVGGKVRGDFPRQFSTSGNAMLTQAGVGDSRSSGLNQLVYRYHFEGNRWSVVETSGSSPGPRQLHAAVAISREYRRSSIFVFGGTDKTKHHYFDDLWELRDIPMSQESDPTARCINCFATRSLVNNEMFSDIRFRVDERTIHAHRCILYCRSEYFRKMFDAGMREAVENEISVPGVGYDVFLSVMEYLYTGRVTIKEGRVAVNLLQASDMFGLEGLRAQCVEKVESAITVDNAAFICEVADTHNAQQLKDYCITFILHNFKEVINSTAWADLQSRDSSGLGREILNAFSDSAQFNPAILHKRPRASWR